MEDKILTRLKRERQEVRYLLESSTNLIARQQERLKELDDQIAAREQTDEAAQQDNSTPQG